MPTSLAYHFGRQPDGFRFFGGRIPRISIPSQVQHARHYYTDDNLVALEFVVVASAYQHRCSMPGITILMCCHASVITAWLLGYVAVPQENTRTCATCYTLSTNFKFKYLAPRGRQDALLLHPLQGYALVLKTHTPDELTVRSAANLGQRGRKKPQNYSRGARSWISNIVIIIIC